MTTLPPENPLPLIDTSATEAQGRPQTHLKTHVDSLADLRAQLLDLKDKALIDTDNLHQGLALVDSLIGLISRL